jgi:hypothetical protein
MDAKNKKKSITIKTNANKLGGKNYFITNKLTCGMYLDTNSYGNLFYSDDSENRNNYRKWLLSNTEMLGVYTIKNIQTELYLTSTENGDLYTSKEDPNSSFQQWQVLSTSESLYLLQNLHNSMVLSSTKTNQPMMVALDKKYYDECPASVLIDLFSFKPKK